jgi:hypothetical protein
MLQNQPTFIDISADTAGLTFTAYVSKDGGNFTSAVGTVTALTGGDGKSYVFKPSKADTDAHVLCYVFVTSTGLRYSTGTIFTDPSPLTFSTGWTLLEIITKAQSRIDQPTLQPSGKFSKSWWIDVVNSVQSVAASEVGYKRTKFYLDVHKNSQLSTLPASMCKNIRSIWVGNQQIEIKTDFDLNETVGAWRQLSSFPNQPLGDYIDIVSDGADVRTVAITGSVFTTGNYQTETPTLNGASLVTTSASNWGEAWTLTLSAVDTARTVTVKNHTTGATIATITPGQTVAGIGYCGVSTNFNSLGQVDGGGPRYAVLDPPNVNWWPIPAADYTATLFASSMPVDLIADTDMPDSLPVAYQDILVNGACALAELGDLYSSSQSARENQALQSFWTRLNKGDNSLAEFINSMSADRQEPVGVSPEGNYQERFSRGGRRQW